MRNLRESKRNGLKRAESGGRSPLTYDDQAQLTFETAGLARVNLFGPGGVVNPAGGWPLECLAEWAPMVIITLLGH